jgi:hypothetical protein
MPTQTKRRLSTLTQIQLYQLTAAITQTAQSSDKLTMAQTSPNCHSEQMLREYRLSDGSGGWGTNVSGFGTFAETGGNNREFSFPWSAVGGRPASFAWFGYLTSSGGFVYGQVPTENAGGNIGTSARYSRYYIVNNTDNGTSTKPFSRNSYVFNSTTDITDFGAITVYDFTMNTASRSITRTSDGSSWTINGALRIYQGTVNFGSNTGSCTVSDSIAIASGGTLTLSDMPTPSPPTGILESTAHSMQIIAPSALQVTTIPKP